MSLTDNSQDLSLLPLDAWHRACGGRMVPFVGHAMPMQYEGIIAEHLWTREHAGLLDVSHMGQLVVSSADGDLSAAQAALDAPFAQTGPCMHEALFGDAGFAAGFSTLDLAKGLIDEGFHPMTVYFPLVVHGAMLVEPTETESKAALDQFILAMRSLAERAKAGDPDLHAAPRHAPRRRLDETLAARKPKLVWRG